MVSIENYLRKFYIAGGGRGRFAGKDDFFPLDDNELLSGHIKWFKERHLMYIPGALIITINGVTFLDFKYWDYPYWLYEQLCGVLDKMAAGEGFEISCLEPGDISVVLLNKKLCLLSYTCNGKVLSRIDCRISELYTALLNAALQAFYIADKYSSVDCSGDIKRLEACLMIWQNRSSL